MSTNRRNVIAALRLGTTRAPRLTIWRYPPPQLGRLQLAIGICQHRCSAANQPHAAAYCCCRSTGQTDGWTDTRPLHGPCSTSYAGSVSNEEIVIWVIQLQRIYSQLRSANRHLLAVARFWLNTYVRPSGVLSCWPDGLELSPGLSEIQRAAKTVLGVYLKRTGTCSRALLVHTAH